VQDRTRARERHEQRTPITIHRSPMSSPLPGEEGSR
jgi:hypothetical protein